MAVPTLQQAMATDLAATFTRDIPKTIYIGSTPFTTLLEDISNEEIDAFGGPEVIGQQRVHFKASDLAQIENGSLMTIDGEKKIVVKSLLSGDDNELIVSVRKA